MSAIVFAGPSLPPRSRSAGETMWEWRPPVRQGDLYRAALTRPAAIGLIDGYFEIVPTVWHKEILWAMAEGVHVFGAASTGALRAAELDVFGMRGVGRVYQDFRSGGLADEDEVAVLHGPAELGYPPVTEAMVNIRATLAAAAESGILAPQSAADLALLAKGLFYKERTWETVLGLAATRGWPAMLLQEIRTWLPTGRIDQKRADAEAMLAAMRAHLAAGGGPLKVAYRLANTVAWQAARRQATAPPEE
jgi:hypothetical protein